MKNDKIHLKRARRTLSFMRDYFQTQYKASLYDQWPKDKNWKEMYGVVAKTTSEWCDKALKESGKDAKNKNVFNDIQILIESVSPEEKDQLIMNLHYLVQRHIALTKEMNKIRKKAKTSNLNPER